MIGTKITRMSAQAGFVPAGKLSYSYRSLLPVLALCLATAAWSQTPLRPRGRGIPGTVQLAKPAAATPATAQYDFITIKIPDSTGADAYNINDSRLVTGDYYDSSGNGHGFLWQDGGVRTLDHPGSLDTLPSATNNQGVVIGFYGDSTTGHAATYSLATGTWKTLPDISGMQVNYGDGINDLGVAVGTAGNGSCGVCFSWMWDPLMSAYSFFVVPGATSNTAANGINDLGQVAGGFYDASGVTHGFLKDGDSYTTFDVPGTGNQTGANEINNNGGIVGAWYDASGTTHGYVRSPDGLFTIVDVPGTSGSAVYGINDHGDLCGVYLDASGVSHAYVALKH
jgi:probable HAF family extracellular repeat protein